MTVRVLLFSVLREKIGSKSLDVTLSSPTSVAGLWDHLAGRYPALEPYGKTVRVAVNEEYAAADRTLEEGDEVALITPVSGG